MSSRRLTALFLIAGIVGVVVTARPHAQLSGRSSISAPQHHAELPLALVEERVVLVRARLVPLEVVARLHSASRTHTIYLEKRSLLL